MFWRGGRELVEQSQTRVSCDFGRELCPCLLSTFLIPPLSTSQVEERYREAVLGFFLLVSLTTGLSSPFDPVGLQVLG